MTLQRREFLRSFSGAAVALSGSASAAAGNRGKIRAITFDAFPILDVRPVFGLVEQLCPGRGTEVSNLWRTRQFEYMWLRTLSGRYADFRQVTEDSLTFATKSLKVNLTADNRDRLMQAYLELKCWPDVPDALAELKRAGIRLAFLSNMTTQMLEAGIRNSHLDGMFEQILSTDRVKAFKPDPRAYQMGLDRLGLKLDEVLFTAFAGWDAAGAKAFGYRTFWVNRMNQAGEEMGTAPDGEGRTMEDLVKFVKS